MLKQQTRMKGRNILGEKFGGKTGGGRRPIRSFGLPGAKTGEQLTGSNIQGNEGKWEMDWWKKEKRIRVLTINQL